LCTRASSVAVARRQTLAVGWEKKRGPERGGLHAKRARTKTEKRNPPGGPRNLSIAHNPLPTGGVKPNQKTQKQNLNGRRVPGTKPREGKLKKTWWGGGEPKVHKLGVSSLIFGGGPRCKRSKDGKKLFWGGGGAKCRTRWESFWRIKKYRIGKFV